MMSAADRVWSAVRRWDREDSRPVNQETETLIESNTVCFQQIWILNFVILKTYAQISGYGILKFNELYKP